MKTKKINIGILGCGVVGTGVAKLLMEKAELLESRIGVPVNLKYVADLDTTTDRGISFPEGVFISDAGTVINDPDINIIVELIGGTKVAKDFTLKALENGKHVVTANKALIASFGNIIVQTAREKELDFAFEASVGGCMPVIKSIRESLVANRIDSMTGILNGTCNYILTKITSEGCPFDEALKEAQEKGYAEADPFLDIEGHDSAHKLAILTSLAYGMEINLDDIYVEGISSITPMDIQNAREFGYSIKLLAISKNHSDSVEARVHPTMIPESHPLAHVNGSMNAVTIDGDATGRTMLYGAGAGMMPTASAVVSDIADIARNIMTGSKKRMPILGSPQKNIKKIPIMPFTETSTCYYIRLEASDHPGVLSKISGILGDQGISIKSVHQKGRRTNGTVPVVMITHKAMEKEIQKSLAEIASLDAIPEKPVVIRIEEE
ncbi:Homoserine dehydrogenase [Desulfamplus magnetovallimortis]|uniref:Homoserine dehydrogenase n=1 Tax=Desulfamplus magnetovallimortis TaxID=1246637 RepID=A0A1W1HBL5_9BACT|nr:homoserine dehydrogenase [Desulfamplus magnetovallimortis]SLM29826.1 Homoserine dehydrogenase [Desulfamplus magnetovallimortis]